MEDTVSQWSCYCLKATNNKTYIGVSVDIERRLRQHNRELVGGAKYTGSAEGWRRVCFVHGFPTHRDALQFEWKWKHLSRKAPGQTSLDRRLSALQTLVSLEQPTKSATPFSAFPSPLQIFAEDSKVWNWFQDKDLTYAILVDHRDESV